MATVLTATQVIDSFMAGKTSREDAMQCLHMGSYSELLNALADRGIAPPKPPQAQVEAELEAAMPILRMLEAARGGS